MTRLWSLRKLCGRALNSPWLWLALIVCLGLLAVEQFELPWGEN
jgi:hypothetical protein